MPFLHSQFFILFYDPLKLDRVTCRIMGLELSFGALWAYNQRQWLLLSQNHPVTSGSTSLCCPWPMPDCRQALSYADPVEATSVPNETMTSTCSMPPQIASPSPFSYLLDLRYLCIPFLQWYLSIREGRLNTRASPLSTYESLHSLLFITKRHFSN